VTNRLAVILIILIAIAVALDAYLWDSDNALFLARKFIGMVKSLAFWR